ncbi:MAG: ribonuclease HII [Bacteroidetes bacterium CG12_big_fil_rev_8_21_14_0_65_60_17]|nr:MAG: ribonuclease HII [Bacteroidetes bacterium CG12_big_fil_rev_8_21_14_0_65_60_17]
MIATHGTTMEMERFLHERGYGAIAGTDEAGRGCLAGPVVAAAVILPMEIILPMESSAGQGASDPLAGVTDSKALSADRREKLATAIRHEAVAWAVAACSPVEIDKLNILWASMEAMRRALVALDTRPDYALIDGRTLIPSCPCPSKTVIGGDARSRSIAAASILAKTHRDAIMHEYHTRWPCYGWDTNVGYPTKAHYEALRAHGPSPMHRTSFRLE